MTKPKNQHCVLFVDDEPDVTRGIRLALRKEPYKILTAGSAREGLEILGKRDVDIVVSDQRMPEMGGAEFLKLVKEQHPETIRLILSGQADLDAAISAINDAAIYRFLLKPCAPEDLAFCLSQALEVYEENRRAAEKEKEATDRQVKIEAFDSVLDQLWMAFQPIIRSNDESVFGYEALVRFQDPAIENPTVLFDVAEELDRVIDLERIIRQRVGEALGDAPPNASVLVNVHPRSLSDETLYDPNGPLAAHAKRVVIEIIERDNVHDVPDVRQRIAALRDMGFRIAVDDLGAGYAGLTSFALLCPDIIKFDMELIQGIHEDSTRAKLVSSFTALCREMGIMTIAEGVEIVEERDRVIELDCDLIQGFYYSPPKPEFHDPLQDERRQAS